MRLAIYKVRLVYQGRIRKTCHRSNFIGRYSFASHAISIAGLPMGGSGRLYELGISFEKTQTVKVQKPKAGKELLQA